MSDVTTSDGRVNFTPIERTSVPPILLTLPADAIPVPAYLHPWGENERDSSAYLRNDSGEMDLLSSIESRARQLGALSMVVDRVRFLEEIEEMTSPDEFTVGFGLYTSTIANEGATMITASTAKGRVVHEKVRADFVTIFTKGKQILESLEETEQAAFLRSLGLNFTAANDQGDGATSNKSMYLARNALFDILARPESIIGSSTVFATRLVKAMVNDPRCFDSVKREYRQFVTDPRSLVRNPEALFMLDEFLATPDGKGKAHSRKHMERLCGGVVSGLMHRVRDVHEPDSYPAKLASAYFTLGERQIAQMQQSGSRVRGLEQEHNVQFMPQILVSVAHLVAKNSPEELERFHNTPVLADYSLAFDYLLPLLEIEKLWPEIQEPATMATIKRAYSQLIHKMDDIYS
jgi:hypothetical protein